MGQPGASAQVPLRLYEEGADLVLEGIRSEPNSEARKAELRELVASCLTRAEALKQTERRASAVRGDASAGGRGGNAAGGRGAATGRGRGTASAAGRPGASGRGGRGRAASPAAAEGGGIGRVASGSAPPVRWEDVAGLENAKAALQEAAVLPIRFPDLFTGERKPWRGILLYGPPGTGKSRLAQAVATEVDAAFFSVTSSDLVSKWVGESEKQASRPNSNPNPNPTPNPSSTLFPGARPLRAGCGSEARSDLHRRGRRASMCTCMPCMPCMYRSMRSFGSTLHMRTACTPHAHRMVCTACAPHAHCMHTACVPHAHRMHTPCAPHAQVDALVSARTDGENDSTRRLKNELLVRMSEAAQGVLVLAATNVPWALDPAVRRRFERRIHVPLPEAEARATLLRIHLGATPHELSAHEVLGLATRLDGFSGSDLSVLVRRALS